MTSSSLLITGIGVNDRIVYLPPGHAKCLALMGSFQHESRVQRRFEYLYQITFIFEYLHYKYLATSPAFSACGRATRSAWRSWAALGCPCWSWAAAAIRSTTWRAAGRMRPAAFWVRTAILSLSERTTACLHNLDRHESHIRMFSTSFSWLTGIRVEVKQIAAAAVNNVTAS